MVDNVKSCMEQIMEENKIILTKVDEQVNRKNSLKIVFFLFFTFTVYKSNCAELYKSGQTASGVYTIDPDGSGAFDVFCDQTSAGGGWTVFQKRMDGSVDFYLNWTDYKNGFGNLDGEFWLGLDKIHRLANSEEFRLLVELGDWEGNSTYAEYDGFDISNGASKYRLSLGTYHGENST